MGHRLISHKHDDGRACVVSRDGKTWRYWDEYDRTGGLICRRPHPDEKERTGHFEGEAIEIDVTEEVRRQADRGEFGMPGLGKGSNILRGILNIPFPQPPPGLFQGDGITHMPPIEPKVQPFVSAPRMFGKSPMPQPQTDLAKRIMDVHLPKVIDHFLKRNAEYGDDDDFDLGVSGQYVDISRKVQKLKRRWWDDEPVADGAETDEVIVMELIGHLLMSLEYLAQEAEEGDGQS
jgi:hypothetical protein